MRSTLAPTKPRSMNTRAPASSSAARVAAWLSARVFRRVVTSHTVLYLDTVVHVKFVLIAAMAVGTISVWVVNPLVWLWITSRLQSTQPRMGPYVLMLVG